MVLEVILVFLGVVLVVLEVILVVLKVYSRFPKIEVQWKIFPRARFGSHNTLQTPSFVP